MAKMVMIVFTDTTGAEHEEAFNDWYNNVHVPELCAVPGVVSGRRFKVSSLRCVIGGQVAEGQRYMALYEIDTEEPERVEQELRARLKDGRIGSTETLQTDPPSVGIYYDEI